MSPHRPHILIAWFIAALALAGAAEVGRCAEYVSADTQFLDGLRQRQLYELAETYCEKRLADPALPDRQRAELTIQSARTLAEHAAGAPPERQAELWRRAKEILDTRLQQEPAGPWRPLVAMQRALVSLARGELARQQAQVGTQADPWLKLARDELRDTVTRFRELTTEVDQLTIDAQQPLARRAAKEGKALNPEELISLGRNLRYESARALMSQARCYDAGSPDRAHGLTQAAAMLDELAGLPEGDALVWKSRLARIECSRLLSDYAAAGQALAWIEQQKPPADVALRAHCERVRLALDQGQVDRAVELLQLPASSARQESPEWDFTQLRVLLAAWQAVHDRGDSTLAGQWQTRATQQVRQIEARHGDYWTRRAEMLLASYFRDTSDLDTMARTAKTVYLAGQLDDAVALYDRAAAQAATQGDPARALELGYLAAMILQKQSRHDEVARRCRELALAYPEQPKAPEVHAQAIRNAAQQLKGKPGAALDDYAALLEEHLNRWPDAPTAADVRWWLGGVRRYQGDWLRAIAAYEGISPADPRFADAVDALGACHESRLAAIRAAGKPTEAAAAAAAGWFDAVVHPPGARLPERLSPAAQHAALWAARMWLHAAGDGYARAQAGLTAALAASPDARDSWRGAARALQVAALAGQGRTDEAEQTLARLASIGPAPLFEVLDQLRRVEQTADPQQRARLAGLRLRLIDLLARRQSELTPDQRLALQRLSAGALVESGRAEEALQKYAALVKAHPRDGELREAYAQLLAARTDRPSLDAALAEWRQIEQHSESASPRWFRAKYAIAELHFRLGQSEKAEKIIRLLALLHPELGGPEMKSRFERLLEKCRQP